ncbi:hypothetical protein Csa_018255, partial [Cucumis sativus]
ESESLIAKRILPLKFKTHHEELDDARIVTTLYTSMCVRAAYYFGKENPNPIL